MEPRARIKAFLVTELAKGTGVDVEKDSLVDSGIIDSLGIMKLVSFLEKELKVKVKDDELLPENFDSLDAITRLVAGKSR